MRRVVLQVVLATWALPQVTGARAGESCEMLAHLSLAHTAIVSTDFVPATRLATATQAATPGYCRVRMISRPTVDSTIAIEVAMPQPDAWNGRYLQVGNSGFAGSIPEFEIARGLALHYAVAATDNGHTSDSLDAGWALGHPEKLTDFAYRALKETTTAARKVLVAYEGRPAGHAYFEGCSSGGREALMEAQRYPEDFDGILVGAPASNFTHLMAGLVGVAQALSQSPASYIPRSKLQAIETAEVHACASADRIIENPATCDFDPAAMRCSGAENDQCLTGPQVAALRKIYSGLRDPNTGAQIFPGYTPGAEAEASWGWSTYITGAEPAPSAPDVPGSAATYELARSFFQNIVFGDRHFDIRRLDLPAALPLVDARFAAILNSNNADLSAFKARGGKIIQYHGWADPIIPPRDSIAYFHKVSAVMGDPSSFYRLFMAPGMLHCGGGPGPSRVVEPALGALTAWVEAGAAPTRLVVKQYESDTDSRAPPPPKVLRTRPLCSYPQTAQWDGKGPTEDAASFRCRVR